MKKEKNDKKPGVPAFRSLLQVLQLTADDIGNEELKQILSSPSYAGISDFSLSMRN